MHLSWVSNFTNKLDYPKRMSIALRMAIIQRYLRIVSMSMRIDSWNDSQLTYRHRSNPSTVSLDSLLIWLWESQLSVMLTDLTLLLKWYKNWFIVNKVIVLTLVSRSFEARANSSKQLARMLVGFMIWSDARSATLSILRI